MWPNKKGGTSAAKISPRLPCTPARIAFSQRYSSCGLATLLGSEAETAPPDEPPPPSWEDGPRRRGPSSQEGGGGSSGGAVSASEPSSVARPQLEYLCENAIRAGVQGNRGEIFAAEVPPFLFGHIGTKSGKAVGDLLCRAVHVQRCDYGMTVLPPWGFRGSIFFGQICSNFASEFCRISAKFLRFL